MCDSNLRVLVHNSLAMLTVTSQLAATSFGLLPICNRHGTESNQDC